MNNFSALFREGKIRNTVIKNRIAMSPMNDGMANPDGSVSDQAINYYTERAKGGVGMILSGMFIVDHPVGRASAIHHRIDKIGYVKDLYRLTSAVHKYGAVYLPQLVHAGAATSREMTEGNIPLCVSDKELNDFTLIGTRGKGPQQELTTEELEELVGKYIQAARFCELAECDGVELHGAHSYLVNQLLSPATNFRTDKYGGSFENRMRFLVEVIRGIRNACSKDFIIGVRMPMIEMSPGGMTDADCRALAVGLEAEGVDFLDLSVGIKDKPYYNREVQGAPQGARLKWAPNIKNAVKIPVMVTGMLREPDFCNDIIDKKLADFVFLGRPLICDPYWPKKALEGRVQEIRPCISCMVGCFGNVNLGRNASCVLNPAAGSEAFDLEKQPPARLKKVLVIGGGMAGLQAAITAAKRGHDVTLYEKSGSLGGQLKLASVPPGKDVLMKAVGWYACEAARYGVNVVLNEEAIIDRVRTSLPDTVIFAAGAEPWTLPVSGADKTVQAWDILSGKYPVPEGKRVVIIGGGIVGCELAHFMAVSNNSVTVLEMLPAAASGLEGVHYFKLMEDLNKLSVSIHTQARVVSINDASVVYEKEGGKQEEPADLVVMAVGQKPSAQPLLSEITSLGIELLVVGDANRPATVQKAVRAGYNAGGTI